MWSWLLYYYVMMHGHLNFELAVNNQVLETKYNCYNYELELASLVMKMSIIFLIKMYHTGYVVISACSLSHLVTKFNN